MKKKLLLIISFILLLSLCTLSFASTPEAMNDNEEKVIEEINQEYEKTLRSLNIYTESEIAQLVKENYAKEKEMLASLNKVNTIQSYSMMRSSSYTGAPSNVPTHSSGWRFFSSANEGKSYNSSNASAAYDLSGMSNNLWVDIPTSSSTGTCWSWIGARFKYTGDVNRTTDFRLEDAELYADVFVNGIGSNATAINTFRVYDATDQTYIVNRVIQNGAAMFDPWTPGSATTVIHSKDDYLSTATVKPNHTYVIIMKTELIGSAPAGTCTINKNYTTGGELGMFKMYIYR